jgi:GntR family transcriptional regulator
VDSKRIYARITSRLRERILRGTYRPLERLPSERELSKAFGVSRVTIRRVLVILKEERLIYRRQGSGTYVSPNPTRRIPLMIDYPGSMREHAPNVRRRVLRWGWEAAGEWAAEMLEIAPEEEVLDSERVDLLRRVPIAYDRLFLVRSSASRLTKQLLTRVDFIETWMKSGRFRLKSCRQIVETDGASPEVARHLRMKRGQPVLKSTELYITMDDRPAGVFVSFYHPTHICISSEYRWTDR